MKPKHQIERAARIYHTSNYAAKALETSAHHFRRWCKKHGIQTPEQRKKQQQEETRIATKETQEAIKRIRGEKT